MAEPFLGEIRIMSFDFPPKGWTFCNGQLLPINQNQALFALLGTRFGGNGQTNFALPDLRQKIPMHTKGAATVGTQLGENAHTLTVAEMPTHTHDVLAYGGSADSGAIAIPPSPAVALAEAYAVRPGGVKANVNLYGTGTPGAVMAPAAMTSIGGSQPHENRQPYLALNFCIALQGIFPSRN